VTPNLQFKVTELLQA